MTAAGLHPKARPGWRDDATAAIDAMSRRDRRRLYGSAFCEPRRPVVYDVRATEVRLGKA